MKRLWQGVARQFAVGMLVLVVCTVILGGAYPAAVWVLSRATTHTAEGTVVRDAGGCAAGSALIGVDLRVPAGQPDGFLHGRVAGGSDDPMAPGRPEASGPSNLGPSSTALRRLVDARRAAIAHREGTTPDRVPPDAVAGSGSGLDPHISPAYATLQIPRLARVNHVDEARVRAIIARHTEGRQWGFLGSPRVDVLQVNLALGHRAPGCAAPPARPAGG
ncbi:potassium-transporting ATPase subunit C [Gordonia sp. (in: high G+C Gram-positive bacteria)]|uniref:potassium-transporting ATPase subunit C n=1 Tax=Gordonia sp. (in: high G+C Gram-positive bacteria) TaxID=84139 RepID=UPI0039E2619D